MRRITNLFLVLALILALGTGAAAAGAGPHILDDAQLLTQEQLQQLETQAARITGEYDIGIYILLVRDFTDYGQEPEIFDVLWNYYHDNGLGSGKDRQGLILMISLEDRSYATFFYGEDTEYAFNSYGQEQMESSFLDDLGEDDWFGACEDFLEVSDEYMALAEAGEPVREGPLGLSLLFVGIALFISFVITRLMWMRMAAPSAQKDAARYQAPQGLALTHRADQFIGRHVTRRIIQDSSRAGSSTSHSGGGGSGRSGNF